ncbi:Mss4-like protein [Trichoderma sp. SZMC 28014]
MDSYTGTCNCGSVTVTLATAPSMTYACHCLNCRRAGGPFSINYILDEDEVTVNDSNNSRKQYIDSNTKSKRTVKRTFCQICGSPLYSQLESMVGKYFVKASLFDEVTSTKTDVFEDRQIQWV